MRLHGAPQINVPVWRKPSAGVGDTRPFAWSEVSARGRRNRSCACSSAGVGDTRPFAWSEMSARGRRRKRGAAAGAMLGRVWAAGGSGGGSVASASRSNRRATPRPGPPLASRGLVTPQVRLPRKPGRAPRLCAKGKGASLAAPCVGAAEGKVRRSQRPMRPALPQGQTTPTTSTRDPSLQGSRLARRLRRLEPRAPTPPCRWGAVGPGSARPGELPARPS